MKKDITQKRLKELLHYNPETGALTWKQYRNHLARAGSLAGCFDSKGYIVIRVEGKIYFAHRLAWLYMKGTMSKGKRIIHKDLDNANNKWGNLKLFKSVTGLRGSITQARLKELIHYDPDTGVFTSRFTRGSMSKAGTVTGSINDQGYILIGVDGTQYRAHRLAWLYMKGYFPKGIEIDHKKYSNPDNRRDNRWCNLRLASHQCNIRNTGNPKDNTSGVKGVYWDKSRNKWAPKIGVDGIMRNLGRYTDFDEAVCARLAAEQCVTWSGCDSSSPAYKYVKERIQHAK